MLVVMLRGRAPEVAVERCRRHLAELPTRVRAEVVELDAADTAVALRRLARLAEDAAGAGRPLAVVDPSLVVPDAVRDIVLDDPRPVTRALVAPPAPDSRRPVLVREGLVVAAGTEVHRLPSPSAAVLGLVVVAPRDVPAVAEALDRAGVVGQVGGWRDLDVVSLLLTAVVRHGVEVRAVPLEPFPGGTATTDHDVARLVAEAEGCDEVALRWRRASRSDDGFFSTFVLRRLSRRLTPVAARAGLTPNVVTTLSLVVALAAAAAFVTGSRTGLVVGALLMMVSLVVDCVDGELARFTRNFTELGAWLDASTDRVKEYGLMAALAVGSVRTGTDVWVLAAAAMALQTVKHMQDFSFAETVLLARRRPTLDTRSLADLSWGDVGGEGEGAGDRVERWSVRTGRRRAVYWAKRVVHMPIGERWLVLALGAAVGGAQVAFAVYLVAIGLALAWTTTGWVLRSLTGPAEMAGGVRDGLADLRDDGPLHRPGPRADARGRLWALAWLAPPAVTALEAVASVGLAWFVAARTSDSGVVTTLVPWAFVWFFAVGWRRYDVFYRRRDHGAAPGGVARALGLGWAGRTLVLAVTLVLGPDAQAAVLAVGAVWLVAVFGGDAVHGIRTRARWTRPAPAPVGPVPGEVTP